MSSSTEQQPKKSLWSDRFGTASIRILQTLIIAGGLVVLSLAFKFFIEITVPVLLALILAMSLNPIVSWLERNKWHRGLAAITTLIGVLAVLAGVITFIVFVIKGQVGTLTEKITAGIDNLQDWIHSLGLFQGQDILQSLVAWAKEFFASDTSKLTAGFSTGGHVIVGTLLTFIVLFFLLKDGTEIWKFFRRFAHNNKWEAVKAKSGAALRNYTVGLITIAAINAIIVGIGLWIMRVPLAAPLAIIIFLFSFVPIIGAITAGAFAALIALVTLGLWQAIVVVIITVVVNQLEHHVLQPLVMGKRLHTHPLTILIGLTFGTIVAGLPGAILMVPVIVAVWEGIKAWGASTTDTVSVIETQKPFIRTPTKPRKRINSKDNPIQVNDS